MNGSCLLATTIALTVVLGIWYAFEIGYLIHLGTQCAEKGGVVIQAQGRYSCARKDTVITIRP